MKPSDLCLLDPIFFFSVLLYVYVLYILYVLLYLICFLSYTGGGGVWAQLLGGQGACARVILFFCECIWNAVAVSLVTPAFDGTVSWVLLRVGWSIPLVPPWVTASRFLAGNREAELKPTTFSSLLLFHVFQSFLLTPQRYSTFDWCLLGLLLNN